MKFMVEAEITDDTVANLLCCAFEGGSGYWCRLMDSKAPSGEYVKSYWPHGSDPDWVDPKYISYPLSSDGAVICRAVDDYEDETADEEGNYEPLVLNRSAIERGLSLMQKNHPRAFADIISENEDAETGDIFLQYCLLGEVVYG